MQTIWKTINLKQSYQNACKSILLGKSTFKLLTKKKAYPKTVVAREVKPTLPLFGTMLHI